MRCPLPFVLVGLAGACLFPATSRAQSRAIDRALPGASVDPFVAEAAQRFALPAAWLQAIIRAESRGQPRAVSPKGAMGLMQIMPATWRDLRARHRLGWDAFDPHDNIIAGAGYIRELFDRYGSPGWIAAYNAGPGRYEAALRGRPLPAETRSYLTAVAPAVGAANTATLQTTAIAVRVSWTRSSLFIVREVGIATSSNMPTDPHGSMPTHSDGTATTAAAAGLFVARTSRQDRP